MNPATRIAALNTAATVLRPLASFMLKCGLTWRELSVLAKTAFVAAATEEYGLDGRPTNISRVALLCGLARKEVSRQRAFLADPQLVVPQEKTTDATRVLSGWYQDAAYLGADHQPAVLTREQFQELCRRYSAEVPPSALLKELLRVGAVAKMRDQKLQVRQRYYMPTQTDPEWMLTAGHYIADLAHSISHNIALEPDKSARFLGRATETRIPATQVDEFRAFLEQEGQAFLERVDSWLGQHAYPAEAVSSNQTVRLGVGVFQIQDTATSSSS